MTDPRFERLKDIIARALDLPETERGPHLERACAGDPSLRAEAERILAADPGKLRALQTGGLDPWLRAALEATPTPGADDPERVGPYRVLRVLGEGGMGVVYLAEQTGAIRRQVALKLIKLGMDTREVISRFEGERQALALMDHPHVAKVFDAGVSDQGRPYFVMEYAPGIPITEFCDRERLSMWDRLQLFSDVCLALQHAHQRGIIHRDVKPSNILVSMQQARPTPKVIDFGVAKAINQRLTERTVFTERGVFVGTPEYMSPEQAESTGSEVDTTTDVYSLGVLLYELLTGALPVDREEIRRGGWEAMQQRIRTQDPPRPSERVAALGEAGAGHASNRGASVTGLRRQLRGDLDWIVMKAIERERNRRYSSAAELAADVGRYLKHEAVLAGPPSTVYRVRKFARRHRTALAVAGIVFASLAIALVQSNQQRQTAERARDESEAVTQFLVQMLGAADPRNQGRSAPIGEILDRAAAEIEGQFDQQPVVKAGLRSAIGTAYGALGDFPSARKHLEAAVLTLQRELGVENRKTLSAMNELATVGERQGRYAEAESLEAIVLAVRRRTLGSDHPETLQSMANLALIWSGMGRRDEAMALTREALDGFLRVSGEENRETLETMHNLANNYREAGHLETAESLHVRVLSVQRRLLAADHPELLASLNSLAVLYLEMGRLSEAESLFVQTVEIRGRTLGPEHPETMTALNNLASVYSRRGRFREAKEVHHRILDARLRLLGEKHPHTLMSMGNLGDTYTQGGDPASGEPYLRRAAKVAELALGPAHAIYSATLRKLGVCLGKLERYVEAETTLLRAHTLIAEGYGAEHERTRVAERDLVDLYEAWGRDVEAGKWRRAAAP